MDRILAALKTDKCLGLIVRRQAHNSGTRYRASLDFFGKSSPCVGYGNSPEGAIDSLEEKLEVLAVGRAVQAMP